MLDFPPQFKKADFSRLRLPTRWICDACNQEIASPDQGWIEWYKSHVPDLVEPVYSSPRIVHKRQRCQTSPTNSSSSYSIGDDSILSFQNLRGLKRLVDRIGESLTNPDASFVRIAWRLVIEDFDFGQQQVSYKGRSS